MEHRVVIVESPSKAKTINKYLGRGYEVIASYGHVRDLPSKDGSVDPDNDFAMIWELDGRGSKQVSAIAAAVKDADRVILATDPDREGEAISWHLLEALKARRVLKDKPVERVTFNAITKDAVATAMANPRQIDQALVDAYLARRALDYLVGFQLSPVLWRKLPGARSAGRVQSVALRLVCDREGEIERFVTREYWSLVAKLATPKGDEFEARLSGADGKKITRLDIGSGKEAEDFKSALEAANFTVASVEAKPAKRHPFPPFTTSTLQQEASRKLGFAPAITMRIAQKLYEGVEIGGETTGLITYMRTDGVDIAPEARDQVRAFIAKGYDKGYLPEVPRAYTTKAKNAQEAHECIRPTDAFRVPAAVKAHLSNDEYRLYELIWKRTIASQMESARLERTTVDIIAKAGARTLELRATGQVVNFDGFLTLYTETSDDDEDEDNRRLPAMTQGDTLARRALTATQHFTEPPPRYSEASLIKRMEELGIGRPSTYAATLAVLRDREYVRIDKKRLVPEDKGRIVTAFLESFFLKYIEYDFTADLENDLDRISNADIDWRAVLRAFWADFKPAVESAKERRTTEVLDGLSEHLAPMIFKDKGDGSDPRACPKCGGGQLSLKLGKLGPFVGCSNYPECRFTRPLSVPTGEDGEAEGGASGTIVLGPDPATGLEVTVRDGRFGPYVQLGEGEKPKRASLAKGQTVRGVDLEQALALLSLPREIGKHPESGEPILAGIGRYGPYVQHGKTYANLEGVDDVFTVGINRAVDLIATKEAGGGRRFGRGAAAGRVVGEHPQGGEITLRDGRYGAYVNWGKVNATIPKNADKDALQLAEAIAILEARIAVTGETGGKTRAAPRARAAAKSSGKPAAKKPAAKKAAARKPAAKKPAS
jgi:DNA topoisomerase-1